MRINARLDSEDEKYLIKVQKIKGLSSITDALKYALREAAMNLTEEKKAGDKMHNFLKSDFVGLCSDSSDASTNYKEYLYQDLQDKHDIV